MNFTHLQPAKPLITCQVIETFAGSKRLRFIRQCAACIVRCFLKERFYGRMASAVAPNIRAWWDVVKPLMQPLEDRKEGEFWSDMEEIYHLD